MARTRTLEVALPRRERPARKAAHAHLLGHAARWNGLSVLLLLGASDLKSVGNVELNGNRKNWSFVMGMKWWNGDREISRFPASDMAPMNWVGRYFRPFATKCLCALSDAGIWAYGGKEQDHTARVMGAGQRLSLGDAPKVASVGVCSMHTCARHATPLRAARCATRFS